jgi:hypothetical protein
MPTEREQFDAITRFFEALGPADVARLSHFYSPEAFFKDPFNEVRGIPAITGIFDHMFVKLDQPRFKITRQVVDGRHAFLTWDFYFAFKGQTATQCIRGGSHLILDDQLRIEWHRDYWDAAEELYEKLPILGSLMRWLKRRAAQ